MQIHCTMLLLSYFLEEVVYRFLACIMVGALLLTACSSAPASASVEGVATAPPVTTTRDVPAPSRTSFSTTLPVTPTARTQVLHQQTYTEPRWNYQVTYPATWRVRASGSGDIRFQTEQFMPQPYVDPNDTNEDEFFAGGVGIRGPITPTTDDNAWMSVQPNHSQIVAMSHIETPLGPGRVYTLERDRSPSTWKAGAKPWQAQYAYIPAGDISYELWVQILGSKSDTISPTLTAMLETFTAPNDVQIK